jgi:predicted HTH transcriptional regulator
LALPLPEGRAGILEKMVQEKFIMEAGQDRFNITNLGAILFAKKLADFDSLSRKAVRVISYKGRNRVQTIRELPVAKSKGYANGFEEVIRYINEQLPANEVLGQAFRREVRMYPEVAIRELVANALIHQDFSVGGDGPKVEIFEDRVEITNPGRPLIDTLRFVDEPPQSRNEHLAAMMRRMNICEERGSGIDKVLFEIELHQLPAPEFRVTDQHTVAILYAAMPLARMDKPDRIRACYLHACLRRVSNDTMTNETYEPAWDWRKRTTLKPQGSSVRRSGSGWSNRMILKTAAGNTPNTYPSGPEILCAAHVQLSAWFTSMDRIKGRFMIGNRQNCA